MIRATEGHRIFRQAVREHILPAMREQGFSKGKRLAGMPTTSVYFERAQVVEARPVIETFGLHPRFHRLGESDGIHCNYGVPVARNQRVPS